MVNLLVLFGVTYVSVGEGLLTGVEWLTDSCITLAHPSAGDSSHTLGTWSPAQSLEVVHQVGECPLQATLF